MASDLSFVEFVAEQINNAGTVSFRKMFGEYAVYVDGKVVMLICDNRVFIKPTESGKDFLGEHQEAPPYPQAKPHLLADDFIDDRERMSELIRITVKELPEPKPKKPKPKKNNICRHFFWILEQLRYDSKVLIAPEIVKSRQLTELLQSEIKGG